MTPNVFISSTIADLHYLRDALREAVEDLAYRPVMSDYGDVGYISETTAAGACYRTVRQCQLVVLVVGRRYGTLDKDGLSITHREFITAQDSRIPFITFAEAEVLSFKQVFDTDPSANLWTKFQGMDNAKATFGLIDQVRASAQFNGMIAFTSAGEAKKALKKQIADFVGERLADLVLPVRSEVQEVLAEIKSLRGEMKLAGMAKASPEITRHTAAFRFLLDDRAASFKNFLERLFGDIDPAIPYLLSCPDLKSIVEKSGRKLTVEPKLETFQQVFIRARDLGLEGAYQGGEGFYWITQKQEVFMSPNLLASFDRLLAILKSKLQ
jgi:hypothetical protein